VRTGPRPAEACHRITVVLRGDDLVDALDALATLTGRRADEVVAEMVETELRRLNRDPDVDLVRARRRRRFGRARLHLVDELRDGAQAGRSASEQRGRG
jgi:hypothetical protein